MDRPLADRPPPYGTIVFDCDSTLSDMEGVEELARDGVRKPDRRGLPDLAQRIAALTDAAMAGEVPLEEVFGQRLEWIRPTRDELERVGRLYVERALPHARELVQALVAGGKRVVIVSGGLLPAVDLLARHLGVHEVHAVDVRFGADGSYAGFDEASPLARAGGKIEVLEALRARGDAGLAFVGDGATDLEAAHLADRFIAFGGVERRENVFRAALVSSTARDLLELASLLLSAEEREALRSDARFPTL